MQFRAQFGWLQHLDMPGKTEQLLGSVIEPFDRQRHLLPAVASGRRTGCLLRRCRT